MTKLTITAITKLKSIFIEALKEVKLFKQLLSGK